MFKTVKLYGDFPIPKLGPGLSRPKDGQYTRSYRLRVDFPSGQPMLVTLPAPDRRTALRYAFNRWPGSSATILGLEAPSRAS